MAKVDSFVALRSFVLIASLVIIFAGIRAASPIVEPFILSVFIAIMCNPIIQFLGRYRVPKVISIILIMVGIMYVGIWVSSLFASSAQEFSQKFPLYRAQLLKDVQWVVLRLQHHGVEVSNEQLMSYLDPNRAMSLISDLLSGLGNVMTNLFLILLTVVFMLFEASTISHKMHYAMDDPKMRMRQMDDFLIAINRYVAIKTIVSLTTGVLIGIGVLIIGIDYPLLWAVLAFLLNYIPNVGSIFAALPTSLLALVQFGIPGFIATVLLYFGVNITMGSMIEPRFMGKGLGLSTLVVFLSLIFWGWMLGAVGMLLSVPLTMFIKIALDYSQSGKSFAIILSGTDELEKS
tara:strand:- start:120 stop:1160 length:1041 start_codon:yes stop_codon:yes gene_type:complete